MSEFDYFLAWWTPERVLVLYYVYNNAVQALPDPLPSSSRFYLFFYRFAHGIAANWGVVKREPKVRY